MGFKHIIFEKDGGVAKLTLNRPPLNILNIEMMNEMTSVFDSLQKETLKVLVLQANGKAFSAGVDVAEHTLEKVHEMITTFHKMFRVLNSVPALSLAAVNGPALGGGCELATFCDIVIASENAKFGQPEIKAGVFAPVAAIILPHLIGRNKALELLMTGETIDAKEAEKIRLINKCVPVAEFNATVEKFIDKIRGMSAPVLRFNKRAVDEAIYSSVMYGMERTEELYLKELMKLEDAQEGLQAFLEKRPPEWKDR